MIEGRPEWLPAKWRYSAEYSVKHGCMVHTFDTIYNPRTPEADWRAVTWLNDLDGLMESEVRAAVEKSDLEHAAEIQLLPPEHPSEAL